MKKFEEMTRRLTEHEARERGLVAGGQTNLIAKKQNIDNTSKCDWDFMVECLTVSVSTEWLKNFRV